MPKICSHQTDECVNSNEIVSGRQIVSYTGMALPNKMWGEAASNKLPVTDWQKNEGAEASNPPSDTVPDLPHRIGTIQYKEALVLKMMKVENIYQSRVSSLILCFVNMQILPISLRWHH